MLYIQVENISEIIGLSSKRILPFGEKMGEGMLMKQDNASSEMRLTFLLHSIPCPYTSQENSNPMYWIHEMFGIEI